MAGKKPDLDPSDGKSYRPISNLTVLSKVLERLVARQLIRHLSEWKLLPELQSAYRAYHSTATAVLRVVSDILEAVCVFVFLNNTYLINRNEL